MKHLTADGKHIPLDFFSWHCYGYLPEKMYQRSIFIRNILDEYGYNETESILNEWNYIKSWDDFVYSVKHIISIKGAAFTAACMCGCQNETDIDMLMYYDARPCAYNGLFDYYTNEHLKGYYPFIMFNALYKLGNACKCVSDNKNIYAAAAKDDNSKAVMLSFYTDDDDFEDICDITLDFSDNGETYEILLLDKTHDAEYIGRVTSGNSIKLAPNTVCLLKSTER